MSATTLMPLVPKHTQKELHMTVGRPIDVSHICKYNHINRSYIQFSIITKKRDFYYNEFYHFGKIQ